MVRGIVVISEDFSEPWDEGIKNFTWSLGNALRQYGVVTLLNVDRSAVAPNGDTVRLPSSRTYVSRALVRAIGRADPGIIVYVPSPSATVSSFARSWVLRRIAPRARVGMVALIPRRHYGLRSRIVGVLAPHRVFVPSYCSLLHLYNLHIPGSVIPMGINTNTFHPRLRTQRDALRGRYGIDRDAFVFLHVGHIRPRRNLDAMASLARQNNVVSLVVSSTSTPEDPTVRTRLVQSGVRVIREFLPVQEMYALSDCYVFPVVDPEGSIEFPLSVLEALASGLPVISRAFGGLRDHLPAGDDLRYFENDHDLEAHARAVQTAGDISVRDMSRFSWPRVAGRLLDELEGGE